MLLLRKGCQPILNKYGLNGLHVELSTGASTRYLVVATACGKHIAQVNSIGFDTGIAIEEKVREYAIELFKEYMNKHSEAFIAYTNVHKALKVLDANPPKIPRNMAIDYTGHGEARKHFLKVNAGTKLLKYSVYPDGVIRITGGLVGTLEEMQATVGRLKTKLPKATAVLKEQIDYRELQIDERTKLRDLNQCRM